MLVVEAAEGGAAPRKGRGDGGTSEGRGGLRVMASSMPLVLLSSLLLSPSESCGPALGRPSPLREGGPCGEAYVARRA